MADELICLKCPLFDCDESDPGCLYRMDLKPPVKNTEANREKARRWYQKNREKKLAQVREWQKQNVEKRRANTRAYEKRKKIAFGR